MPRYIRADCLLMNPHAPMWQMKSGRVRRLINSRLVLKSGWGSLCSEFNVLSIVCALWPLPISILIGSFSTQSSTKSLYCTRSTSTYSRALYRYTGCAHTSCTHFNWIIELMSSLRNNYALYRDTMPLTFIAAINRIISEKLIPNTHSYWFLSIV